ncbi:GL16634 [Drosophila persimilis]|uniref:GL16634 n=1 Tax=Drosophila persimilis TaxID=7234 RepID=B4IR59_DROPE|nr:GL16634 [Drosophila persimilis]
MQGHGGLADSFLSSPLWQPLSRLSYSVYIWHMFTLEVNSRILRTNTYFSNYNFMLNCWSVIGITIWMSYVLYVIIEAPFGGLDSPLRTQQPRAPSEQKQSSVDVQQDQLNDGRNLDEPEEPKKEATTTVSE